MENNTKKSGKAGYIITIIFLLIVIVILSVLFAFKETIFPIAKENVAVDSNTLISNTLVENTTNTINETAQRDLINSVKGYWIATTGDLFLSISDTTDSSGNTTTNFSLTGASGMTASPCTIDSTKINCNNKTYSYKIQGNYLILSYDNIVHNFAPSNYYQLSKQSKKYYAQIMGYSIVDSSEEIKDSPITGEYINKAILGTWKNNNVDETLTFELQNGSIIASKVEQASNQVALNIPVGMSEKYIQFIDSSTTSDTYYSYQITDNGKTLTISAGNEYGLVIHTYTKVETSSLLTNQQ